MPQTLKPPSAQPLRRAWTARSLRRDRRSRIGRRSRRAGEDRRQDRPHPPARRQVGHPGRRDLSRPVRRARPRLPDPRRRAGRNLLDLGLIYGDGPKHDAFCYQVPAEAGAGVTCSGSAGPGRPRPRRPGARRATCRAPPARTSTPAPGETRTEVLVPNSFSEFEPASRADAGALGAAAQRHRRDARRDPPHRRAFDLARRINRGIYREVIRRDVLGNWLMPRFRERYAARDAAAAVGGGALPHAGRVHGRRRAARARLVREIYSLNDQKQVAGLRNLVRQTRTGRPHDMPLTEDWLVDFSRFFAIGSSVPQRARALGPHVARPFATGTRGGDGRIADGLVLRDLIACTRGGLRSVRSLIARAARAEPRLFEGCFAQDETTWIAARGRLARRHRARAGEPDRLPPIRR